MGVPTSEFGYTLAMPRREDHEVHKDMWCHWTKKVLMLRQASWSSGQSLWLLIMRSRNRFPALPWQFSLKGQILAVTIVWVGQWNLGLRALLALHPPISPPTSSGQRNCASWASQPQNSVTLLPCPGGRTTKSTRTFCGIGKKSINAVAIYISTFHEGNEKKKDELGGACWLRKKKK